jgi:solute carrier family 39 (zinc transporter), member 7
VLSKEGKKDVQSDHKHGLAAAGVLNIIADLMHNFTDGIAIGVTYSTGGSIAAATTISIFFHEIPHELGDFAILLESGFTKFQAIKVQMVTALAAVLGTLVGLCAGSFSPFNEILLSITTGGFLFVSTLGILPMISSKRNLSFTQITLESLCFLLGVALMVMVAFMEEWNEGEHHGDHNKSSRDGHHDHHDEH